MDIILFQPMEYHRLYNCSAYKIDDIPLDQRRRPVLGAIALGMFALFEILYLPVLMAMRQQMAECCYKLMFSIGVVDVCALFINGLLSGILALMGAVFCSFPTLNIWAGFLGMFFWCAETRLAIVLALNRLLILVCPRLNDVLFYGWRPWLWVLATMAYSLAFAFVEQPLVWNSITFSWFFDPHIGYMKSNSEDFYSNKWDALEGIVVAVSLPTIYLIYFIALCARKREGQISQQTERTITKIIFLQTFYVCLINSLEATIYVLMGLFPAIVTPQLVIVGTFAWISVHGLPSVIYLTVNQTLRKNVRKMFGIMTDPATIAPSISGLASVHQ